MSEETAWCMLNKPSTAIMFRSANSEEECWKKFQEFNLKKNGHWSKYKFWKRDMQKMGWEAKMLKISPVNKEKNEEKKEAE